MVRMASLLITAGLLAVAGSSVYAAPPADSGDDPPVLLKKKGAPEIDDPPPPAADKKDKDKAKKPDDAPKPDANKGAPPEQPKQDAEEVLKRVAKNMHTVEKRLANKELGDATRQAEEDALKDLDSLIDLTENPPQSKDDQNESSSSSDSSSKSDPSQSSASKPDPSRSSSPSSGSSGKGKSQGKGKGKGRVSRTSRGNNRGSQQPGAGGGSSADKQPGGQRPGDPSNSKGADGGKETMTTKDHNADLYKDVWGHLPETLRAEMNAYSNTKGFMPEYEALISKYYRTIAEQGRRKGD
jgi:hypothetical protein